MAQTSSLINIIGFNFMVQLLLASLCCATLNQQIGQSTAEGSNVRENDNVGTDWRELKALSDEINSNQQYLHPDAAKPHVFSALNELLKKPENQDCTTFLKNLKTQVKLQEKLKSTEYGNYIIISAYHLCNAYDISQKIRTSLRSYNPDSTLCDLNGQSSVHSVMEQMDRFKLFKEFLPYGMEFSDSQPIEAIEEFVHEQRRKQCEQDGYFVQDLIAKYNVVDANTRSQVENLFGRVWPSMSQQLGGLLSMQDCMKNLNEHIITNPEFEVEIVEKMYDYLKPFIGNREQGEIQTSDGVEVSSRLINIDNIYAERILNPCEKMVKGLKETIKAIRLYQFVFGKVKYIEIVPKHLHSLAYHFYGPWSKYNLCELIINDKKRFLDGINKMLS